MGIPSYRSGYSGKGSTNISRREIDSKLEDRNLIKKKSKTKDKSAMVEMLELLEEVERCREVVTDRQSDLDSAKKDLERAEQKVSDQINKLDPETKARFRRMMGGIGSQEQEER